MANKHLTRSKDDRIIAGVAGGLSRYLDVDPLLVRLVFVLLAITFGAGILAYIAAIIIIPEEKEERMDEQQPAPGAPEAPAAVTGPANETAPEPTSGTVAVASSPPPVNPFLAPSVDAAPTVSDVATPEPAHPESAPTPEPATPPPLAPPPPAPPVPPMPAPPTATPPTPPETPDEEQRRRRMAFGLVLVFLGILFLFQQFVPAFDWGRFWPVLLIGLGAYLLLKERD